jgi:dTMP kinase
MPKRGAFIVIEGLDKSGKTTQTSLLHDRLQSSGVPAKLLKFPDRTTSIGKMIDSYLRSQSDLDDRAIHLLFAANRWELASTITTLLASGTTVLADRYAFSGIAFSASKVPSPSSPSPSPPLTYEWCRNPEIGLLAPDITLFLDIDPEKARERGGYGEERYEKEEVQRRVRGVFDRIGKEMLVSEGGSGRWTKVDAGEEKDVVQGEVWALVEPLVGGVQGPVKRLWEEHLPPPTS